MRDKSIFHGVVLFENEGYRYQAICKGQAWHVALFDGASVLEMRIVKAPADAAPHQLLAAWWHAQKNPSRIASI